MSSADRRIGHSIVVFLMAALGSGIGGCIGIGAASGELSGAPKQLVTYPLPHHAARYPGGVSLRFAMVHDVIHERFPRHGRAYYAERNRRARLAIDEEREKQRAGEKPSPAYFALVDDLGAGLDYLGEHDEAVYVLRGKLDEQEAQKLEGRALYTTYANLGTFLIHGNFARARTGDAGAKERLREGLSFIHQSIAVNPEAHFGREVWQAVAVEFMLAAVDKPETLLQYDLIGNRWDRTLDPRLVRSFNENWAPYPARELAEAIGKPGPENGAAEYRRFITEVGAESGWPQAVRTSHRKPVAFDEPVLGIIGMWRLGGGANPHFALALGEIMMRVGQRYIAWCAYERAVAMQERFWPDPDVCQKLVTHCRARQALIEKQLPPEEVAKLRPRFEAELAYGRRYQEEYQRYEADRIAAGASVEDPHFYDDFHAAHELIASAVGEADKYVVESGLQNFRYRIRLVLDCALFGAGLLAFCTACILHFGVSRQGSSAPDTRQEGRKTI